MNCYLYFIHSKVIDRYFCVINGAGKVETSVMPVYFLLRLKLRKQMLIEGISKLGAIDSAIALYKSLLSMTLVLFRRPISH